MRCTICASDKDLQVLKAKDVITNNKFSYGQCTNCGALQLSSIPQNLSEYYFHGYYSFKTSSKSSLIGKIKSLRDEYAITEKGFIGKIISEVMPNDTLRAFKSLNIDKTDRILDIGCGTGKEIALLRKYGFRNAIGLDPFITEDIYDDYGLLVKKESLENFEGEFDKITLHHSFEHMHEPEKVLRLLHRILAKDGVILIRIPLADSYAFEKYGTNWVQLDAPRHSFLHTKKSMQILSSKTGYGQPKIVYDSRAFQFWASDVNKKGKSIHTLASIESWIWQSLSFFKRYETLAKNCNRMNCGDQAAFFLKKQ